MALPSKIYKATIELSDIDRGRYETLQATVAQHPSETAERLLARLLAYAIFCEDDLTFTKGLCATDEPDLWLKGGRRPRTALGRGGPARCRADSKGESPRRKCRPAGLRPGASKLATVASPQTHQHRQHRQPHRHYH
ncbi:YaeQ family protein [Geotalea toluenoxydans]|uniref:YaeQ family protein n=1 Tax=Geotalea toluenoxydans TaxID=421624 RepID=UPI000A8C9F83